MSVLYVKEQGAYIQKRSERLLVTRGRQTLLEIPVYNIDSVALIGSVQLTAQAMQLLLEKGVEIRHFSFSGKYLGSTSANMSRNIFLRLAQYKLYNDIPRRLELARIIVANKIRNQVSVISSHRWEKDEAGHNDALKEIRSLLEKVPDAATSNELMGLEGRASSIYFRLYGAMFKCGFKFSGRSRRPPRDPINVIISLGYTFLTNEVSSALETESFEMYLGLLHGIRYGRKSLPLDIVEEFRQPVIDRMALKLFNKSMLHEADFTVEEGAIILVETGFKKFCAEFEKWMSDPAYSGTGRSYRSIIQAQAASLKAHIQKGETYQPFCLSGKHSM